MERVWRDYRDAEGGGLYDTVARAGSEGLLPARAKPVQDAPSPSGNGVAAINCARLFELTGDRRWSERRDEILGATAGTRRRARPARGDAADGGGLGGGSCWRTWR